jgi:hypothetical protein
MKIPYGARMNTAGNRHQAEKEPVMHTTTRITTLVIVAALAVGTTAGSAAAADDAVGGRSERVVPERDLDAAHDLPQVTDIGFPDLRLECRQPCLSRPRAGDEGGSEFGLAVATATPWDTGTGDAPTTSGLATAEYPDGAAFDIGAATGEGPTVTLHNPTGSDLVDESRVQTLDRYDIEQYTSVDEYLVTDFADEIGSVTDRARELMDIFIDTVVVYQDYIAYDRGPCYLAPDDPNVQICVQDTVRDGRPGRNVNTFNTATGEETSGFIDDETGAYSYDQQGEKKKKKKWWQFWKKDDIFPWNEPWLFGTWADETFAETLDQVATQEQVSIQTLLPAINAAT